MFASILFIFKSSGTGIMLKSCLNRFQSLSGFLNPIMEISMRLLEFNQCCLDIFQFFLLRIDIGSPYQASLQAVRTTSWKPSSSHMKLKNWKLLLIFSNCIRTMWESGEWTMMPRGMTCTNPSAKDVNQAPLQSILSRRLSIGLWGLLLYQVNRGPRVRRCWSTQSTTQSWKFCMSGVQCNLPPLASLMLKRQLKSPHIARGPSILLLIWQKLSQIKSLSWGLLKAYTKETVKWICFSTNVTWHVMFAHFWIRE